MTIMQGCNNACAYCVVPHVRGREESRPLPEIVHEVEMLALRGIREVTLLGQNVNSYGRTSDDDRDFTDLICALGEIPGIERSASPPRTRRTSQATDRLLRKSGSFVRTYPSARAVGIQPCAEADEPGIYRRGVPGKVAALRKACPEISITSDVILGFPGEEEEDFQATLALLAKSNLTISSPSSIQRERYGRRRNGSPGERQREAGKAA